MAVPQTDQLGAGQPAGASAPASAGQPAGAGATARVPQESWEIADCFFELIGTIMGTAEQLAQRMSIPSPFVKALHILEHPMAMKEIGKRMHCDPSFVTLVADMLEKRGLARREPHPADRRVKNLVLTDDGLVLKHRIEAEVVARMPWNRALDDTERSQLLALIRKMLGAVKGGPDGAGLDDGLTEDAQADDAPTAPDADADSAIGSLASMLVPDLHEHVSPATRKPPVDGGGD